MILVPSVRMAGISLARIQQCSNQLYFMTFKVRRGSMRVIRFYLISNDDITATARMLSSMHS